MFPICDPLACGGCVCVVQAVKEKVVNFAMFKAVFAAAVLGDQVYEEVFVWVTWFSVVGLLNVVSLVCRLRLDAVSVRCCARWGLGAMQLTRASPAAAAAAATTYYNSSSSEQCSGSKCGG